MYPDADACRKTRSKTLVRGEQGMLGITPTGKQQEVMALPAKGHIVVLGTAGSGKTTIALYRAHHLANIPGSGSLKPM